MSIRQSDKKDKGIAGEILRYIGLTLLVGSFGLSAPLWGLTQELVNKLTDEATYVSVVKNLKIGQLTTEAIPDIGSFLPKDVLKYLDDGNPGKNGQPSSLAMLNTELEKAIDQAAVQIAAQIPDYITANKDNITGSLNLISLKNKANKIGAQKAALLPIGGSFLATFIKNGINKAIPDYYPLDMPLRTLKTTLAPVRTVMSKLVNYLNIIGALCFFILFLIILISFNVLRAVKWIGFALLTAGLLGVTLGGVISMMLTLGFPNIVLENVIFQTLLKSSVDAFTDTIVIGIILGATLVVFSFILPRVTKALGHPMLMAAFLITLGCGGSQKISYAEGPVDFIFEMNGESHRVAQLRGRPLMIFIVRISELTTELYMGEINKAYKQSAGNTQFLVLSIASYEEPLLKQYAEFNEFPFSLGLAESTVANGQSALGPIPMVPSTYALDRDGRVMSMFGGVMPAEKIIRMIKKLR